jgi:allene oxide cyclase
LHPATDLKEETEMKTRHLAPVLLLAAAALFAAGCGGDDDSTTTIKLVEHADTDTLQHVGPAKEDDSIGDVLGFANDVFNADNTKKVGTDNGMCMRTAVGKAFECVWTVSLEGGQITVEGPFYDAKDSTLAITGGTGDYDQAAGSMTLHSRDAKGTEFDFTYEVVK